MSQPDLARTENGHYSNGSETTENGQSINKHTKEQPPVPAIPHINSHPINRVDSPIEIDGLSWPSIGTRQRRSEAASENQERMQKLSGAVRTLLECIGEDPDREGLLRTPERYAKALMFLTKGYEQNIKEVVNDAIFNEDHREMVLVKDIDIFALCEHHMVPFYGKIHIAYIPNNRVVGLSKLARIAEMFGRRLQVQERMTKQIASTLFELLQPQGVAVVMEATHMCMVMRGVQKPGSKTVTSCMLGAFLDNPKTREEFLSLIKN
ncbi:hypothetical protein BDF19DRAFT_426348 [Syncephalis fuscata]|nr:hypothetical protein BDF19DRAFT_426348 [Syncephalis fuscata]